MIAIVVPTIREEQMRDFKEAWTGLFIKHRTRLIQVCDGPEPYVLYKGEKFTPKDIMGEYEDVIFNLNDGIRNLGFAFAAQLGADIIISLDDDVLPEGDPIQDHLDALNGNYPISWFSTANEYMRGFPYNVRDEAECWVSHGVWLGVPDLDGITQIKEGSHEVTFPKCPVPKGALFPFCAMNFAFKVEALPYIYQAPMFGDIQRFADIWGGVELKKDLDRLGKAVVTGYATIYHQRASNVYKNIQKEARGIEMNDYYGEDPYFKLFQEKRARWQEFVKKISYEKWNCDLN